VAWAVNGPEDDGSGEVTVRMIARPEGREVLITSRTTLAGLKQQIAQLVGVPPAEQLIQLDREPASECATARSAEHPPLAGADAQFLWELGVRPRMTLRVNAVAAGASIHTELRAPEEKVGLAEGGEAFGQPGAVPRREWCFGLVWVSLALWAVACVPKLLLGGAIHWLVLVMGFIYLAFAQLWLLAMLYISDVSDMLSDVYRRDFHMICGWSGAATVEQLRRRRVVSAVGMWALLIALLGFTAYGVAKCPDGDQCPHAHGVGACRITRSPEESACFCEPGFDGDDCEVEVCAPSACARNGTCVGGGECAVLCALRASAFSLRYAGVDCQPSSGWLGISQLAQDCATSCRKSDPGAERFVWVANGDKNCKCASGSCDVGSGAYAQDLMSVYEYTC
jgi:hypothetical protein